MLMRKGTPIGLTDQLLRDIVVGDELTDAKGKTYIVNAYGYAKPLSGGNEVPIKSLKGCEVSRPWKPDTTPMPGLQPAPESPVPEPEFDPAPPAPAQPTDKPASPAPANRIQAARQYGKPNKTGFVDLQNITRYIEDMNVAKARALLEAAGIEIVTGQGEHRKARIRLEDKPRAMEVLLPDGRKPKEPKPRGHRSNKTGVVQFVNLEPSLGRPASDLKAIAEEQGFAIVRNPNSRNAGIREEDADAFRRAVKEHEDAVPMFPEHLSQEALDAIKTHTVGDHVKVVPAITRFSDQELADELRRRGFEVVAVKRVEL